MWKRFGLVAIRLMVSVNLLYAAIFAKFAGVPQSVALFTQMSQAVHGLISQPVFRLGSGVFESMVAVIFLIPKTARLGARLVILWMTAIIFSHIDRKSTRLNSSHRCISYAVFCLKKKKYKRL